MCRDLKERKKKIDDIKLTDDGSGPGGVLGPTWSLGDAAVELRRVTRSGGLPASLLRFKADSIA